MTQLKFLLPILGLLVVLTPHVLKGQQLSWTVTILGILILLTSGLPLVAEYFKLGRGGGLRSKKSRFLRGQSQTKS